MTETSTRTVVQYRALNLEPGDEGYVSEEDARATAHVMLIEQFRANDEEMTTEEVAGDPEPVTLLPDGSGWEPWRGVGMYSGHIITWTATGHAASHDEGITVGEGESGDGWYEAVVPADLSATGGAVRIKHGLDCDDVIVSVLGKAGEGVGYLFAQEMTPHEVHVEFYAGAERIRVVRNPDAVDG